MISRQLAHDLTATRPAFITRVEEAPPLAVAAGLIGLAFVWGFAKASYVRGKMEAVGIDPRAAAPHSTTGSVLDVMGGALAEEIEFRAGANRVLGPVIGTLAFGFTHLDERSNVATNAFRFVDVSAGGLLYEKAFSLAQGSSSGTSGMDMISGILRGLLASTLAHTAHNVGMRVALLRAR